MLMGTAAITKLALIFLGGGVGSVARYVLGAWAQGWTRGSFPTGTLCVNALGCLAIGAAASRLIGPSAPREEWRLLVMVGFLGGFTTFSSFSWETLELASNRQFRLAALNVLLTNALCLGAAWVGYRLFATRTAGS